MTEKSEAGRVARGQRTREAVIDTLLELSRGDVAQRISGIAHHRAELFETLAPARRSALDTGDEMSYSAVTTMPLDS